MSKHEISRVPAREIITGQVMMNRYFGSMMPMVLMHTAAEWLAMGNGRDYSTWPRFSIPDQATSGRPPIPLFKQATIL